MAPVKKQSKADARKYIIDASANESNDIIDMASFEKYLVERIKVDGKTGQLGDQIQVSRSGNKITVVAYTQFSGKYLRYLTKKWLRKNNLRDWLRVVATSKRYYELKFYNLVTSDAEESEDEEADE